MVPHVRYRCESELAIIRTCRYYAASFRAISFYLTDFAFFPHRLRLRKRFQTLPSALGRRRVGAVLFCQNLHILMHPGHITTDMLIDLRIKGRRRGDTFRFSHLLDKILFLQLFPLTAH